MKTRHPTVLGKALEKILGRPEIVREAKARIALKHWEDIVGCILSKKSAPDRYSRGVLWVSVSSSLWVQELQLRKKELLASLNERSGENLFQDIRFRVQNIAKDISRKESED
ncbi:MAG TPA: DUF721 domain-containing protein [Fimbriimonadales bacterium]|nr:DUF721 domain-containing protein [Fimbriimonadales bacterium]